MRVYTMPKGQAGPPWDGCHHRDREEAFQRVIYSKSYLFTGDPERMFVGSCRRVEAPEIQDAASSSRSRQQIYLSGLLGACQVP